MEKKVSKPAVVRRKFPLTAPVLAEVGGGLCPSPLL